MNLNDELTYISQLQLPWDKLKNKTVLISGAGGTIGKLLIDTLFYKNIGIKVIALGRNEENAKKRLSQHWDDPAFKFISCDVTRPIGINEKADYVIHAASNTHPVAYASDPIGTITTNIIGTKNLLDYAQKNECERFLFLSSVEIYGENRGDTEYFSEDYCGYIDCNTLRAGYPESKRAGEALCQAYRKQYGMEIVIARLSRVYGPTMPMSDSKAIAQFIKKGLAKENIVLKSAGNQLYSYIHVTDAVSALLTVLLKGDDGEAYNVADSASDITLKELAQLIADFVETNIVYELPDEKESIGYSKATKGLLDSRKLKSLGWVPSYNISKGIRKTINELDEKKP